MNNNKFKTWCMGIMGVSMVVLLLILCSCSSRNHYEIMINSCSRFYRVDDDKHLSMIFQFTNGGFFSYATATNKDYLKYNEFYIDNGDELYEGKNYLGYIKVLKDGSFIVKGNPEINGHYVGYDDDKAIIKAKLKKTKIKKCKADENLDFDKICNQLVGDWYYVREFNVVDLTDLESFIYIKISRNGNNELNYIARVLEHSRRKISGGENSGTISINNDRNTIDFHSGFLDECYIKSIGVENDSCVAIWMAADFSMDFCRDVDLPDYKWLPIKEFAEKYDLGVIMSKLE